MNRLLKITLDPRLEVEKYGFYGIEEPAELFVEIKAVVKLTKTVRVLLGHCFLEVEGFTEGLPNYAVVTISDGKTRFYCEWPDSDNYIDVSVEVETAEGFPRFP